MRGQQSTPAPDLKKKACVIIPTSVLLIATSSSDHSYTRLIELIVCYTMVRLIEAQEAKKVIDPLVFQIPTFKERFSNSTL